MLKFVLDKSLKCQEAPKDEPYIIAIGVFDGMHKGHKKVISTLVSEAKRFSFAPCVFTFDRNPKDSFYRAGHKSIQTIEERLSVLEALGVKYVFQIQFTDEVKSISGVDFMARICKNFPIKALVCGRDFSIGSPPGAFGASDAAKFLEHIKIVDDVCANDKRISSTRIRKAIEESGELTADILKTFF